ncbi:zinc-dependent peptidase [Nonlabens xiamenensis]|uniref:zinc-dependent peptidase n=1 Tax=Nonlabens xiamenensis TaxID=2341043 RepID=UPI0013DDA2EC|nr:zinc-dependent peptidase [Nonlabens xiamenensis]
MGVFILVGHLVIRAMQRKRDIIFFRQGLSYRKLSLSRKRILEEYPFYQHLQPKYQRQFEHRVANFIADKHFRHRYDEPITDEQYVLLSAVACRLTFGRRSYQMPMLHTILLFPEAFTSPVNEAEHKGEYNPNAKVLALSWADFKLGMDVINDNLHLGLHEFTHVIHFESEHSATVDATRFHKYHQLILRQLMRSEVRAKLDDTQFFRAYAFTNQYEFMAVLAEYFFESNAEFRSEFPVIYNYFKRILLYKEEWII